jgi:hypothetical protein
MERMNWNANGKAAFRGCAGMGLASNWANQIGRHSKRCALYKVMQMHSQSRSTAQATADIWLKFKT